jgi:hypothetical protein
MSEREPLNNKKDLLQKLLDQHERLLGEEANSPDSIREHLGRLDKSLDTVKNPQERRWILRASNKTVIGREIESR